MKRLTTLMLLVGASAFAGCDVTFYGIDGTRPVIESVLLTPGRPAIGESATINARVSEPDSWYELSYDTDDDGRFDDSAVVRFDTTGWHTIRVRARSAGGEDIVIYPVEISGGESPGTWMTLFNDTGHGVALNIYEADGDHVAENIYVAPNKEFGYYALAGARYEVVADNQYAMYGPDWISVGSGGISVSVSSLDY